VKKLRVRKLVKKLRVRKFLRKRIYATKKPGTKRLIFPVIFFQ